VEEQFPREKQAMSPGILSRRGLNTFVRIIPVVSLAILGGCVFDQPGDWTDLQPITSRVTFRLQETHHLYQEGDPSIALTMVTEREYGCMNYSIRNRISVREGRIFADLFGIFVPEVCLTAMGPAHSHSPLGLSNGDYLLRFRAGNTVDNYRVIVSDASITIEGAGETVVPESHTYWRFPPRSFASICRTTDETAWICGAFIDTLFTHVSIQEFKFPETGYWNIIREP
jgi:hypothetical protein